MKTSFTTATFVALSSVAHAGNLIEPSPTIIAPVTIEVAPTQDWTGFYAGFQASVGDVEGLGYETQGLHVGYLRDLGDFVVGGQLEYETGSIEINGFGSTIDATTIRAKGIAGYDLGRLLPYATAGVASYELRSSNSAQNNDGSGSFVGVGAIYAISDNIRINAEYLIHPFDDVHGSNDGRTLDTITLGTSYSF